MGNQVNTKGLPMIHAYRLVYPLSQHAPPKLYEQPYIDHLLLNDRTFDRRIAYKLRGLEKFKYESTGIAVHLEAEHPPEINH